MKCSFGPDLGDNIVPIWLSAKPAIRRYGAKHKGQRITHGVRMPMADAIVCFLRNSAQSCGPAMSVEGPEQYGKHAKRKNKKCTDGFQVIVIKTNLKGAGHPRGI